MNTRRPRAFPVGVLTGLLPVLAAAACENPQPPAACGSASPVVVNVGETATVDACFNDPNGDMLTYSASSLNQSVATASASGSTISVTGVRQGTADIVITATDPGGLSSTQTIGVEVPNRTPVPSGSIPLQTVDGGDRITLDLSPFFDDPDGDVLTYSAVSSDSAVASTRVSGSMLTVGGIGRGTAGVTVTATDQGGLSATQAFQVEVPNGPPVAVGSIPDQTVHVGKSVTLDVSSFFHDPDGDFLTYAVAVSDSAVVTASVAGSAVTLTGSARGAVRITVTATDPGGLSATQHGAVEVPNRPPVAVGTVPAQDVYVDESAVVDASTYFEDPDLDNLTYTAASSNRAVATASVADGVVTLTGVSTGSADISITASDPGGLQASQSTTVTVGEPPPDRRILNTLYEATSGERWKNSTNWLVSRDLGSWYGVKTDGEGRVTHLELPDNRLKASIPRELGGLEKLVRLDLNDNDMEGRIPRELGDLGNLEYLDLSSSLFFAEDEIPPELGNLKKLKHLDLSDTWFFPEIGLVHAIPPQFGNLESLEVLNLNSASLQDKLPRQLGNLGRLRWLDLARNQFTGEIPREFMKLTLERFHWEQLPSGTLCAPADEEFQAWLDSIPDHEGGPNCESASLLDTTATDPAPPAPARR